MSTAALQLTHNTVIAGGPTANTANPGATPLAVGVDVGLTHVGGTPIRALLHKNLSAWTPANIPTAVSLALTHSGPTGSFAGGTYTLSRLTESFDESTATFNHSSTGALWTTPGGDFDDTNCDYATLATANGNLTFTRLLPLFIDAIQNRDSQLYLILRNANELQSEDYAFWGSTYDVTTGWRPVLNVDYFTAASVHYQCMVGVQAAIQAASLAGISNSSIIIQKLAIDRPLGIQGIPFPAIIISPGTETMDKSQGSNLTDDVLYPVQIVTVGADNQEPTLVAGLSDWLTNRQRIARGFRQQPSSIRAYAPTICNAWVDPRPPIIPEAWKSNLLVSALNLNFLSREPRGFNS